MITGDLREPYNPPIDKHSHNLRDLLHFRLAALDGDIGHISDFYFDDQNWVVRYLVVNTGSWLTGRLVLLTPHSFGSFGVTEKTLRINLHKNQVKNSPPVEMHKPVSRQYEAEYYRYYGLPSYWAGGALWGATAYPIVPLSTDDPHETRLLYHHRDDKHLQSTNALVGYQLLTDDGPIGHVRGFLVDDRNWEISQIVVETGHWYAGKEILVSPSKVLGISYEGSQIKVSLSKSDIEETGKNAHAYASLAVHQ